MSSCFSMELPPAKKAWKSFTSKLQRNLGKLHLSKAIKKPETRLHASPSLEQNMRRRKRHLLLPFRQGLRFRSYPFKKKAAPVYIDRLFREPLVAELVAKYPPVSAKNNGKKVVVVQDGEGRGTGTSSEEEKGRGCCAAAADDLWESLALASPQMHGIDQRAEEFINKFRAEMKLQETMARRL